MHLPIGTFLKNGDYRIEKILGQGGFGITYLAEQISLGRKVAVKEFFMQEHCNRSDGNSDVSIGSLGSRRLVERFRKKFIKEARMIATFHNVHIISIYDVFEENNTAYYVMEYVDGGSLADKVSLNGPLCEETAISYVRQIADALAEVHSRNLLHLDIKPANVMFNGRGEVVLIDFGVSKHYDEGGFQTSSAAIGTSEGYAPLEQYESGALDSFTPATDIYALGATLFYMLTAQHPPKAGDVIVFLPNGNINTHYYIKRVVATPGDTVEFKDGRLYVNGIMEENEAYDKVADPGIAEEPILVGVDEFFVLGDNRNNSEDSRSGNIGMVKRNQIEGKAWFHFAHGEEGIGLIH